MTRRFSGLRNRSFPELLRLGDPHDRDQVWGKAVMRSGLWWLYAPLPALFTFGGTALLRRAGVSDSVAMAMACLGIFLTTAFFAYLLRKRIRRLIWKQLSSQGVRICVECGYDLTGNTSGVCPECGGEVKVEANVPKLHRIAALPLVRAAAAFGIVTGLSFCIFFVAGWLVWGVGSETRVAQDIYAVVCTCIGVVVGYAVARRTYVAARQAYRRYPPGHCRKCGYNLTGNTSGVCPECAVKVEG